MIKTNYYIFLCSVLGAVFASPSLEAQQVSVGAGTTYSVFSPLCRTNDYCVYEIIYLDSEIVLSGNITDFAFQRYDGTNVDPIQNVSLFMKLTTDAQLSSGLYSEIGYQLVYQGAWPNDAGGGWREVTLVSPFSYDGTSNLQILVVKGYEPSVAGQPVTPRWYYSVNGTGSNRARRYYGSVAIDSTTSLTTINYNSNARLTFGSVGLVEITPGALSIYPNPVSEKLQIKLKEHKQGDLISFDLFDIGGRNIVHQFISEDAEIDLSDFTKGLYFYRVYSGNTTWSGKILFQD